MSEAAQTEVKLPEGLTMETRNLLALIDLASIGAKSSSEVLWVKQVKADVIDTILQFDKANTEISMDERAEQTKTDVPPYLERHVMDEQTDDMVYAGN